MLGPEMVPQMVPVVAGVGAEVAEERLGFGAFHLAVPPQVPSLNVRFSAAIAPEQVTYNAKGRSFGAGT